MDFPTALRHLRQRLQHPLPGLEAQLRMAPAFRGREADTPIEGKDCREAGVLALLYPGRAEQPVLVLTVRRDDLPDHPGQISFPGGQREGEETLTETALREAHEEVDLDPSLVEVLGALTPLYIPPSNFCVYPFVGVTEEPPVLRPTDAEVAHILHAPLPALLDEAALKTRPWTHGGETFEVPYFDVHGREVWGATAMMLNELLALFAL